MFENLKDILYENSIYLIILAIILVYLIRFYIKVYRLPKGPLPLPLVGNVLDFIFGNDYIIDKISQSISSYGPVSTLWVGDIPVVFIKDINIAKKAFSLSQKELHGRPKVLMREVFGQYNNEIDIAFSDASTKWTNLRKLTINAISKTFKNKKVTEMMCDIVDENFQVLNCENDNYIEIKANQFSKRLAIQILTAILFGKTFSSENSFEELYENFDKFFKKFEKTSAYNHLPMGWILNYNQLKNGKKSFQPLFMVVLRFLEKRIEHAQLNQNLELDNVCDAIIQARNEKYSDTSDPEFINNTNLAFALINQILAGVNSTLFTLSWSFLYMSYYPEMQYKIKNEIKTKIGSRIPLYEDLNHCHYTHAFLSEVMRLRNVNPIGGPHKATKDVKLGEYFIPKNAFIAAFLYQLMRDERYWKNPNEFNPNRFLVNGNYDHSVDAYFAPFGVGMRACSGRQILMNQIFCILVRSIQTNKNFEFSLKNGAKNTNLNPKNNIFLTMNENFVLLLKPIK